MCHQFAKDKGKLQDMCRRALLFVFLSGNERFGVLILETHVSSCPIALGNAFCFPEIADDAGLYLDPESEDSIRNEVRSFIESEPLRNTVRKAGCAQHEQFSIENLITNTAAI